MAEVASAWVSLLPSAKGFGRKMESEVGGETKGAAKRLGAGFGKAFAVAGGALAAVGVAGFLKDAIGGAGDLEQSVGAIETVFDGSAKQMLKWSKGAALSVGLTKNEFNELGTLIGSQLKNGGTAMDELAPKTKNLITLGADLSSMFGGSTKEAVEALSSALKGERDPIERYGVSLNQAKIDAEAAALGFKKVDGALSQEAQQAATLSLIMKQTSDAHGNFAKESGTYAGKVQRLGAQWGNLKTTIGTALLPAMSSLVGFLNDRVMPAVKNVADNIGPGFQKFKDALGDIRGKLDFGPKLREIADIGWGKLESGLATLRGLTKLDFGKIDGAKLGEQLGGAIRDGLTKLGEIAGTLTAKLSEVFGKVDWVGIGITVGKQAPAILLGLAAGILNFDIGSLFRGIAAHWSDILLGALAIAFAPAKLVGPLARILSKIPFVGPFLARAITWVNQLGGKLTKFGGDLLKSFWTGFTKSAVPGAAFVKRVLSLLKSAPGQIKSFFSTLQTRIGVWALDAFEAMGKGARTATGAVLRFVGGIPGKILSALGSLARTLSPRGYELIAGFLRALRDRFTGVVSYIGGTPGRLLSALGDLSRTFYNKGVELISGLASGITAKMNDAINAVKSGLSKIKGLLPGSPIKWGPLKNWNRGGAGKRLMDLVAKGITEATPKTVKAAQTAFGKIEGALKGTRDRLKSQLDGFKSDFAGIKDSVANAFTGGLFDVSATTDDAGNVVRTVGQNFVDNLLAKKSQLTGLLGSFKTLAGWGIDPKFLTQLFSAGGADLITEIAGMGKAGALSTASLFGEVMSLGDQLGTAVAQNDPVADRIDETNRLLNKVNRQLEFLGSDIGKELNQAASKARRDHKNKGKKGGRKT